MNEGFYYYFISAVLYSEEFTLVYELKELSVFVTTTVINIVELSRLQTR